MPLDLTAAALRAPGAYDRAWSADLLFRAWAHAAPNAVALHCAGKTLTYGELNVRAHAIAAALSASGVGRGDYVALDVPRGFGLVAAQLAAMRLRAAYAPIDSAAPDARRSAALRLLQPKAILTPDHPALSVAAAPEDWTPPAPAAGDDIAAIMFTSGSTGAPKGVRVRHRGIVRLVRGQWFAQFDPNTVFLAAAPPAFDASHLEIWAPLLNGGSVALLPDDPPSVRAIADAIERDSVTDLWLTAGLFHLIIDEAPDALAGARRVFVGGDVVSPRHIRTAQARHPTIAFINGYGPTENTTFTTCFPFPADGWGEGAAPIGRALNATRLIIAGDEGELHVAGDGVAAGYLGADPEQKFRPDPDDPGGFIYATGDIVRRCNDGDLDFLGRADRQVKIAGRRIELAAIENALRESPGVSDAAVLIHIDPRGEKSLHGFVTPASAAIESVRAHLSQTLPPQEIPARLFAVDAFPLTPAGKLDRDALRSAKIANPVQPNANASAPLIAIFTDIIGPFDANARLADLGLTSLQIVRAHARIAADLAPIPITDLFECADLPALAKKIAAVKLDSAPTKAPATAKTKSDAIAIIGMAGRFPGARDIDEFWRVIRDNRDTISRFAPSHAEDAFDAETRADGAYIGARGILDDVDCFDAAFFGMQPREAALTDPQHRVLLELAQHAFDDAGYDPLRVDGPVGMFAGCALNTYLLGHVLTDKAEADAFRSHYGVGMYSHLVGALSDTLAARIAYKLNLRGPAATVQAACATALLAVAQACQSLRSGQCDMALAGAASITFPQKRGYLHQAGGMVSADGVCRPFDAGASGTVFGAGAGLVLLKRLDDALADGDAIHAVIRGIGLSNDGADKVAFTAPSARGQAAAIRMALADARLDARDIGYVECHGTATPLGDPIEIEGLRQAFGQGGPAASCALGSVKANVGHLDAAAGVTGLIKAALCLRENLLPAQLHFNRANAALRLNDGPFFVPRESAPWSQREGPRRAGVSAFGVGGVNVHLILEEPPQNPIAAHSSEVFILPISAVDAETLRADTRHLADRIEASKDNDLFSIAATLQLGRRQDRTRALAIAATKADAVQFLRDLPPTKNAPANPAIFFACPGQGAQYPGMAASAAREGAFRADLSRALDVLDRGLGEELTRLLTHPDRADAGAVAALRQTSHAQPALVAIGWAMAQALARRGLRANGLIGHSVGEITAAAIAGALPIEDAMLFAAARGAAMQSMPAGAMIAVRARHEDIARALDPALSIAAINAPDACVISGPTDAIADLAADLEKRAVSATRLETSHAFHSATIDTISDTISRASQHATFTAPAIRWISSANAAPITLSDISSSDYWVTQARSPVRFGEALSALYGNTSAVLVELGPGRASLGFAARVIAVEQRLGLIEGLPEAPQPFDQAAAKLWTLGADIDWAAISPWPFARAHLPARSFRRTRHWIEPSAPAIAAPLPAPQSPQPLPAQEPSMLPQLLAVLESVSGAPIAESDANASFLELGFDSLLLGQVATRVEKTFGVKIGFRQMLSDVPSPSALAQAIQAKMPQSASPKASVPSAPPAPVRVSPALPAATPPGSGDMLGLFKAQLDALNGLIAQQNTLLSTQAAPAAEIAATAPKAAPPMASAIPRFRMFDPKAAPPAAPLTAQQKAFITDLSQRAAARAGASKAYADRHRAALADPRTASGFRPEWKELAFPVVAVRAKGAYLWGLDGEDYIDLVNGYGQTAFGHAPDFVTEAIARQLGDGFAIGPQSPLAGPLAERLAAILGMERVTFCNTGSEAVMAAMRVARTVTGREKVVVFANDYHGQFDEVLVKPGPAGASPLAAGIPADSVANMIVLAYGAPESLDWISANAADLAAVIVEPVQSRHPELQPFDFLRQLRTITHNSGAALVFDEVVTGFRVDPGGMQAVLGVRADMATYGKVLGGGMPVGILAGARRFMDALDGGAWRFGDDSQPEIAPTFFAGTFVRHPLVLAACAATLDHMQTAGAALQRTLTQKSQALAERVKTLLQTSAPSLRLESYASWFMLSAAPGERYLPLLCAELRTHGLHIQDGFPCFYTTAHKTAEADRIVAAFQKSLNAMCAAGFFAGARATASAPAPQIVPLSDAQLEILLAAQYGDTASTAFNESVTLHFDRPIDTTVLARALERLAQRHAVLRACIDPAGPCLVLAGPPPNLEQDSASPDTVIAAHAASAFDLTTGPLWRSTLCGPAHAPALVLTAHHLICDGWSMNIMLNELAALYSAEREEAVAEIAPAGDFAAFVKTRQTSNEDLEYWSRLYSDLPPGLHLPRSPQSETQFAGATISAQIGGDLIARLRKTGAHNGCTLFATLFAGLQILIARLSQEGDVTLGCPIAGQAEDGFEHVVGHGVQFLPMRAPINPTDTMRDRLRIVRTHLDQALAHSSCTYGALVRRLNPPRNPDQPPLVSVQFNLERLADDLSFASATAKVTPNPKAGAHFDLFFNMIDTGAGLRLDVDYRADRYDRETVLRWIANLERVLETLAADLDAPVWTFDVLSAPERAWLAARQPNSPPLPQDATINAAFDASVQRHPDAPAVIHRGGALTYSALNARADLTAAALAANGIGHGDRVAMLLPRGLNALIAILAILKCGAVYAPIDPALPPEVLSQVIAGMRPKLTIAPAAMPGAVTFASLTGAAGFRPIGSKGAPAYIMHTSGSSGAPKGVSVPHGGVVRLVRDQAFMPFGPGEVMLHAAPLAFDASTLEIWGALLTGGALVIAEEDETDLDSLQSLIARHRVTTAWLTAGLFHAIAKDRPDALSGLKTLITGGDVVSPAAIARVQKSSPDLQIVNGYGPTENTTFTACYRFTRNDPNDPAPIGAPIAHGRVYICTPDLALAPRGAIGEIVVAGEGVALGYLDDVEGERFCAAPLLGETRVYRTGDLGRWRADGLLDFLGRRDGLVKINGHRIDLAGIEAALRTTPGIGDLAAYVTTLYGAKCVAIAATCANGCDPAAARADLFAHAQRKLAPSHHPRDILILPDLPRTQNGKTDRSALADMTPPRETRTQAAAQSPPPASHQTRSPQSAAAASPTAQAIAAIWAEVLHRDNVAHDKGIFDLGADSLHIFRIAARMSDAGFAVTSRRLLSNPSIAMLTEELAQTTATAAGGATVLPLASFRRDRRGS